MEEARADHKVRASSVTPETDGEWLEPVFIPQARLCLQVHARHNVQPAGRQQSIFQEAATGAMLWQQTSRAATALDIRGDSHSR